MRGRKKEVKSLALTGNVYLKYEDEDIKFIPGDILCALNNDAISPIKGDYYSLGYAGYFKIFVYDGYEFQHLIEPEFFEPKENHFSKKEQPKANYNLIQVTLSQKSGTIVYRSYRGHYTTYFHTMSPYKGRKGHV